LHDRSCEHEIVCPVLATIANDARNTGESERREGSNPYPSRQALHFWKPNLQTMSDAQWGTMRSRAHVRLS
jgi:hypothetical protein